MISHQERKQYLENELKKDFELLTEMQGSLRYEDSPMRKGQLKGQIEKIERRITGLSEKLDALEKHSEEALASGRKAQTICESFSSTSPQMPHLEIKSISSNQTIKVFVSFASKDDGLKKKFEETCLSNLRQEGTISVWHKEMIRPGENRKTSIEEQLNSCQLFLPLISPDYIYFYNQRVEEIYQEASRARQRNIHIIPILLRQTPSLRSLKFGEIQHLPKNGKAVDSSWKNQNQALCTIAEELESEIQEILSDLAS
jgi:hypothetical protein